MVGQIGRLRDFVLFATIVTGEVEGLDTLDGLPSMLDILEKGTRQETTDPRSLKGCRIRRTGTHHPKDHKKDRWMPTLSWEGPVKERRHQWHEDVADQGVDKGTRQHTRHSVSYKGLPERR